MAPRKAEKAELLADLTARLRASMSDIASLEIDLDQHAEQIADTILKARRAAAERRLGLRR